MIGSSGPGHCIISRERIQSSEVVFLSPAQQKLLKLFPYVLILFAVIYLTGLAPVFYGETAYSFSNMMLIYGLPAVTAAVSFVYGLKNGFTWYFFLITPLIFTSTIFVFYGGDFGYFLNVLVYAVFSLVFELVGAAMYRKRQYYKTDVEGEPVPGKPKKKKKK